MAKTTPGSLAGAVSGSLGNCTFSHGRYGYYIRNRVVPTKVVNEFTLAARARLIDASQSWGGLIPANQLAWNTYAESAPITDRLGNKQVLTGHAAFVAVNNRILLAGGTKVLVPPVVAAPPALLTMVTTFDVGVGGTEITFTPGALAAGNCLYVQGAVLLNPGQRYYRNRLKLIDVAAAETASPYDYAAKLEGRFGPLVVGQRVILLASVLSSTSGLMSAPYVDEGLVITT